MSDGKQEGGTEKMLGWLMIFVVFLICCYIFYRANVPETHNIIRWIRYGEMWLVSLITSDSYAVKLPAGDEIPLDEFMSIVRRVPAEKIDVPMLSAMTGVALIPYRWFFAGVLGLMALWAYTKGPGTHFIKIFNLHTFLKFQSKAFPVIAPFVGFNPSNQPPRAPGSPVPAELPLFAEALGPEEWLAYNQIPVPDGVIDEKVCFQAFSKQLGPRWQGPMKLPPYQQVLLAGFCLKSVRKRDAADDVMGRLAMCWSKEKGLQLSKDPKLLKYARSILKNKEISHKVLTQCKQHAWQTTAMLRALLVARLEGGVMAPAQFVWLRGHNRTLWYPLNNLGRQSAHMEAIGAMAHFRIERRAKRPIPRPKVQEAVKSIVDYMGGLDARPIPALDYSASKNKSGIKKLKSA